jgi:hypothetical protein
MEDVENIDLPDEAPEADAREQRLVVDPDGDTWLDITRVEALGDWEANPADVIDQAIVVPVSEDDDNPT